MIQTTHDNDDTTNNNNDNKGLVKGGFVISLRFPRLIFMRNLIILGQRMVMMSIYGN